MSRPLSLTLVASAASASPRRAETSLAGQPGPAPLRAPMRTPLRSGLRRRGLLDRAAVAEVLDREWPGLMLRKFTSDEACGDFFGRTRQTGTNWRSGHCKPDGAAVALAWMVWPEDLFALFAPLAARAA